MGPARRDQTRRTRPRPGRPAARADDQRRPADSRRLVFAGSLDRWFRAYDDTTGKVLWQTRTNNAVNAFPISFSVAGKQYIAVAVGNGSSQLRSLNTLTPDDQESRRRIDAVGVRLA